MRVNHLSPLSKSRSIPEIPFDILTEVPFDDYQALGRGGATSPYLLRLYQ
jgi:hypothetical protein